MVSSNGDGLVASTDSDGNTRPQGGTNSYDDGAYEFVSATNPPAAPTGLTATVN